MKLSRRTNTIILWITSIGLLVGMVITFTPTMGALTGGGGGDQSSAPALIVDGETIRELDVAQARRSSPIFSAVQEGPVADDLELLLVDSLVRQEVVRQVASRQRIGNGEVREELEAFRERNGVDGRANDEAYRRLIGGAGYTDATFRDYLRQQLQVQAYQAEITEGIEVSDAEVEAFYSANQDAYRTDPRVRARQIVVDDRETAEELRARALAGESFAELAAEASLERADEGGAVGGDEPEPVGRPAFPSAVADAVFARDAPGVTAVVENAGRFYVVDVEEIVPAEPRPLDEVRDDVREDALEAKQQAELDARIEELVADAEISVPEGSELSFDDPVVATVGEREIRASELARSTYTNPQIQQALSPQTASLIEQFFKPSILEQLVDRELAVQGAGDLDATFFGGDALVAQSALDWVARDAEADEDAIEAYYQANVERFTVPATADVLQVELEDADAAEEYRAAILGGDDPIEAADAFGAEQEDLGTVRQGDLEAPLDAALFETEAFEPLPDDPRTVSDVLVLEPTSEATEPEGEAATEQEDEAETDASDASDEADDAADAEADAAAEAEAEPAETSEGADADETRYVVLVTVRTEERVRPLDEVRSDVEAAVLSQERQALQRDWLEELRAEIPVETHLEVESEAPALDDPAVNDAASDLGLDEEGDTELGDGSDSVPDETVPVPGEDGLGND